MPVYELNSNEILQIFALRVEISRSNTQKHDLCIYNYSKFQCMKLSNLSFKLKNFTYHGFIIQCLFVNFPSNDSFIHAYPIIY